MENSMQLPLQISFRHMDSSDSVAARIRERSEELERFFDRIVSCRVVVECQHPRRQQGNLFRVRVDLKVPGNEMGYPSVRALQKAILEFCEPDEAAEHRKGEHYQSEHSISPLPAMTGRFAVRRRPARVIKASGMSCIAMFKGALFKVPSDWMADQQIKERARLEGGSERLSENPQSHYT